MTGRCRELYYPPNSFGSVECGRPVKWRVLEAGKNIGDQPLPFLVCGVHVRWYRRYPDRYEVSPA